MAINPQLAGAIAQGGGSLLGSIISNIGQAKRQRKQFRFDQTMAQQAYGHDLDMWNRQSEWNRMMWELQNQYNTPAAHMKRLREAGLNPNLVASSSGSVGQAGSIQPATTPKYQQVRSNFDFSPIDVPNILGLYNNFRLANAQVDNVKAQTDLTKEKELTEAVNRSLTAVKRGIARSDYQMKSELANYSKDLAWLQVSNLRQKLRNQYMDEQIKKPMVGRTRAEAGLKEIEYNFFKNLGIKGMREIAPFLQLLLHSFRR